ncbi:MAG TPA: hypothetical protein VE152_09940 [Acidimicrobiales bacterium]|jgi:hypothetical protein|nr:hypothetical protein [Acidimicrobiales bacterium]
MADIDIRAQGDGRYAVEVRQGAATTSHTVAVPATLADEVGAPEAGDEEVIRASFEFLLAREPASSILPEFSLEVISRYFGDYREALRAHLGGG